MSIFEDHLNLMQQELNLMKIENIDSILEIFRNHTRVIFCTMGKSAFACAKITYTARSYGLSWYELDVCHAFHGDAGIIKDGDLLVLVSKSGNTKETVAVAKYFKEWTKIAVTSGIDSKLAKECNHLLLIPSELEGSPFGYAPMISTTLYMIVLHAILCDVIIAKGVTLEQYSFNHPSGNIGELLQKGLTKI